MISSSLLQVIINYLATKPYKEVHSMLHAVQQEVAQYEAQSQEKDLGDLTEEEK